MKGPESSPFQTNFQRLEFELDRYESKGQKGINLSEFHGFLEQAFDYLKSPEISGRKKKEISQKIHDLLDGITDPKTQFILKRLDLIASQFFSSPSQSLEEFATTLPTDDSCITPENMDKLREIFLSSPTPTLAQLSTFCENPFRASLFKQALSRAMEVPSYGRRNRLFAAEVHPKAKDYKNREDRLQYLTESKHYNNKDIAQTLYRESFRSEVNRVLAAFEVSQGDSERLWKICLDVGEWRGKLATFLVQEGSYYGVLRIDSLGVSYTSMEFYTPLVEYFRKMTPEEYLRAGWVETGLGEYGIYGTFIVNGEERDYPMTEIDPGVLEAWGHLSLKKYSEDIPVILGTLLKNALSEEAEEPIKDRIARFHWWFANTMPFYRGSAACAEVITSALWLHYELLPPEGEKASLLDCWALSIPRIYDYIERYPSGDDSADLNSPGLRDRDIEIEERRNTRFEHAKDQERIAETTRKEEVRQRRIQKEELRKGQTPEDEDSFPSDEG